MRSREASDNKWEATYVLLQDTASVFHDRLGTYHNMTGAAV